MSNTIFKTALIIGLFSLFISCNKHDQKGKINRDCSGTYLELNNSDYFVINPEIIETYVDGKTIRVNYNSIPECDFSSNKPGCEIGHQHNGLIEITEVK